MSDTPLEMVMGAILPADDTTLYDHGRVLVHTGQVDTVYRVSVPELRRFWATLGSVLKEYDARVPQGTS